jgi:chromosome partitioning protein
MTRNITITASKGGVTKTTTAVTLAHALAQQGVRERGSRGDEENSPAPPLPNSPAPSVLLADTDPQGHCAISLGMDTEPCLFNILLADPATEPEAMTNNTRATGRPGLWLVPSNTKTKKINTMLAVELLQGERTQADLQALFRALAQPFDYLVFDTAAAGILQETAVSLADVLIIPTALDNLAMDGLANVLTSAAKLNPHARRIILPTLYQKQSLSDYNLNLLDQSYHDYLATAVPHCAAVREAVAQGKTIWEYDDRHSRTLPAVRSAYEVLIARITRPHPKGTRVLAELGPGPGRELTEG